MKTLMESRVAVDIGPNQAIRDERHSCQAHERAVE